MNSSELPDPLPTSVESGPRAYGAFLREGGDLVYRRAGLSLCCAPGAGWKALRVGGAEFFGTGSGGGAFCFSGRNAVDRHPAFPDITRLVGSAECGRRAQAGDGIHLVRVTVDRDGRGAELYLGANSAAEDGTAVLELDPAVTVTAAHEASADGTVQDEDACRGSALTLRHADGAVVALKTITEDRCLTARRIHDSGGYRWQVILPVPGFTANAYRLEWAQAVPPAHNWPGRCRFDVRGGADEQPPDRLEDGPVRGVGKPEFGPAGLLDFGAVADFTGAAGFSGWFELEIESCLGGAASLQRREVRDGSGTHRVRFEPVFPEPGAYEAWLRLLREDGEVVWNERFRLLWDPAHYRPALRCEPDFDAFWDATVAAARARPLDLVCKPMEKYREVADFEVHALGFNGWEGQRLAGILLLPRKGTGPLAAVIKAHPGTLGLKVNRGADGVLGSNLSHDRRFAHIIPLVRGHGIDAADVPFNHPWWGPIRERDSYVARHWYVAMLRAFDCLLELRDWIDPARILVDGGSQGGALALAAAALEPRLRHCLAGCPSNAQLHEILRHYDSFGPSLGALPEETSAADAERILSYYDPANLAARIEVPTTIGIEIGDPTVHVLGPLAAFQNLRRLPPDRKSLITGGQVAHALGPAFGRQREAIFDAWATGE